MVKLMMTMTWRMRTMNKECAICKEKFEAQDEYQTICSDECKQEALAKLDSSSDECLSCQ